MTPTDRFDHPGLIALRSETAPTDLAGKIVDALQPDRERRRRRRMIRAGFATAVAFFLFAAIIFYPRPSFAAAVSRVLKAFQAIRNYHVSSYQIANGQTHIVSETRVVGGKVAFTMYGPDGKPMPDSSMFGDMMAKISAEFRGMSPQALLDPKMRDKVSADIANLAPGPGFVTMKITVDGKEVTDLPDDVKGAIGAGFTSNPFLLSAGGEPDVTYLCGLLKDETIWSITPGQMLNGKMVDEYRIKTGYPDLTLFVSRATSLPVRLRLTSNPFGEPVTMQDDFDYPTTGP